MNQSIQAFLSALLFAFAAGCSGTDVGNLVDIDFAVYNAPVPADQARAESAHLGGVGDITVTAGWLAVERIRVRDAATCQGDAEIDIIGPFALDLFAPGSIPELSDIDMPTGGYCRFELRWDTHDDAVPPGVPPAFQGATLLLLGTRADGTEFSVRSERSDEFRLDALDGEFQIDQATHALFMGLNVTTLFSGVDLDSATVGNDGVIVIDSDSNDTLLNIFDDNLREAANLFDDDDGDGELDDDGTSPDDVLAD